MAKSTSLRRRNLQGFALVVLAVPSLMSCGDGNTPTTAPPNDWNVESSPPAAPSEVDALALSNTEVEVRWTDNSSDESKFIILREPGSKSAQSGAASRASSDAWLEVGSVGANVTTFIDTNLSPGTFYRYDVISCNERACSGDSSEVESTREGAPVATEPAEGVVSYQTLFTVAGPDGPITTTLGLWMYRPDRQTEPKWSDIADWRSVPYELASGKEARLLEPINVILRYS